MYNPKTLNWSEEMGTGDPEIDAQHSYLINFFNELGESIRKGYAPEDIEKVLKIMRFYAEWHFEKEENCMERHHCPAAKINQNAHAVFIQKLNTYQKEYEQSGGSVELAIKIHENLTDWIVNHILVVDTQLRPCIADEK